jgi:hypothetical protein
MRRCNLAFVMLFSLLGFPPVVVADLTYNLQNYPADQNGWTLSGTITTDGKIGTLTQSDITAWTWTITKGSTTSITNSTDPGAIETVSGVTATSTEILLPFGIGAFNQLLLSSATSKPRIDWEHNTVSNLYLSYTDTSLAWFTPSPNMGGVGTRGPWVIAATAATGVPEPSTLLTTLVGGLAFLGHACRRRRAARASGAGVPQGL